MVGGVAVNCCEDKITHIVDDNGFYIDFECAYKYMTASTRDRPLVARFITEVSLRLIVYERRMVERVEGDVYVYTVVEPSDHGYVAADILTSECVIVFAWCESLKTTIANICELRGTQ